jgi:tetratricopeptide (TPR) repeat protein
MAVLISYCLLVPAQAWATCGGGGGGGTGGMRVGSGSGNLPDEQVYRVPWRIMKADDAPVKEGLVLYWFPSSAEELRKSSLHFSRVLSIYAAQCITMGVADGRTPFAEKLGANTVLPVAVLAAPDGTELARLENTKGRLKVEDVEKMLESEMKRRESALKERLETGKSKARAADSAGAIEELRAVAGEKCMFPKLAKDAVKELKKLGVTDVAEAFDGPTPVLDRAASARIDATMRKGLRAENSARYAEAEKLYAAAQQMDPQDPTPLRYLGELHRHHTGDWERARATFEKILAMPADPLSRAIALHGLGKMTIHDGKFKEGLRLMERSVEEFPTPLAYRNLAVYWNSERETARAESYVKRALELDPTDAYNQVFAAAFNADKGGALAAEALRTARAHEKLLSASYNLAAIYAQAGQREKALRLLKRHFYEYESTDAVRAKEMMEARVDAVFTSLMKDPEFVALTAGADGRLPWSGGMSMHQ